MHPGGRVKEGCNMDQLDCILDEKCQGVLETYFQFCFFPSVTPVSGVHDLRYKKKHFDWSQILL